MPPCDRVVFGGGIEFERAADSIFIYAMVVITVICGFITY